MLRSSGGLIFSRNSKKSLLHAKNSGEKSSFPEDYLVEYNSAMPKRGAQPLQGEVLQGTLDLLVLQTLLLGPAHGHTIAYAIEHRSDDVLQVEHGSLYPALHRLEDRGWIASFWGTSENNRKARYYRLTPAGRKQLSVQTNRWQELVHAINRVLRPANE
jgi:PadR family transcriptional regulator